MMKVDTPLKRFLKRHMTSIAREFGDGFGRMESWSRKRWRKFVVPGLQWFGIITLRHPLVTTTGGGDGLVPPLGFISILVDHTTVDHILVDHTTVAGLAGRRGVYSKAAEEASIFF
jgi:hypothetical protein